MASTMKGGMGSVVSPMPRLMILASGWLSWWALRRRAIWRQEGPWRKLPGSSGAGRVAAAESVAPPSAAEAGVGTTTTQPALPPAPQRELRLRLAPRGTGSRPAACPCSCSAAHAWSLHVEGTRRQHHECCGSRAAPQAGTQQRRRQGGRGLAAAVVFNAATAQACTHWLALTLLALTLLGSSHALHRHAAAPSRMLWLAARHAGGVGGSVWQLGAIHNASSGGHAASQAGQLTHLRHASRRRAEANCVATILLFCCDQPRRKRAMRCEQAVMRLRRLNPAGPAWAGVVLNGPPRSAI